MCFIQQAPFTQALFLHVSAFYVPFTQIHTLVNTSETWGLVSSPNIIKHADWRVGQPETEPPTFQLVHDLRYFLEVSLPNVSTGYYLDIQS